MIEKGHLRLRHARTCKATGRDSRACTCSPAVEARFKTMGVQRQLGRLPKGWRVKDLLDFETELADLRSHLVEGRPLRPTVIVTLNDYAVGWFERLHAAVKLNMVSPLTYNQYEGDWRNWIQPAFGRLALSAIDVAAVNNYLATRLAPRTTDDGRTLPGAAETTAKNSLTCLSGMLTDAMAEGVYPGPNPLRSPRRGRHANRRVGVDLQVRRTPPKHLQLDEALALLTCVPDEYLDLVLMPMTHGLRRNENLGMHWEWLDFGQRTLDLRGQLFWNRGRPATWEIRDCKSGSNRLLPFYNGAAMLLGARRQAEGLVHRSPANPVSGHAGGGPWKEAAREILGKAYQDAGIRRPNVLWHALRHTYSSLLAQGGIPQAEIELLMGHKIPGTTGRYLHLMHTTFPKVQAILDDAFGDYLAARLGSITAPDNDGTFVAQGCGPLVAPKRSETSAHANERKTPPRTRNRAAKPDSGETA